MAAAAGVLNPLLASSEAGGGSTGVDSRNGVSTTSHGLLAGLAVPDADRRAANGVLAAECFTKLHVSP